jgi:hypothetical protein
MGNVSAPALQRKYSSRNYWKKSVLVFQTIMLFGPVMAIGYQALRLAPKNYEQNTRKNWGRRVLETKSF